MSESSNERIEDQILSYLLEHPDAQDTLEGIAEWWMLERTIQTSIAQVQRALEALVQQGWLHVYTGADKKNHFRIDQAKLQELSRKLRTQ